MLVKVVKHDEWLLVESGGIEVKIIVANTKVDSARLAIVASQKANIHHFHANGVETDSSKRANANRAR